MEPQIPPPAASAHAHHPSNHPRTSPRPSHSTDYAYSEKDAYHQHYSPRRERGSNGSTRCAHDSVISHPFSPKASSPPSPGSSVSSIGQKHRSVTEVQASPLSPSYPRQAHLDPEKGYTFAPHSHGSRRSRASNLDPDAQVVYDDEDKGPENKTVQLLLFLSGPCAALSSVIAIWTIFVILFAILLQPLRLFTTRASLSAQITTFLASPLNLQLHLIYSFAAATDYSPSMLVVVLLFSPFVAMGVAISAWISACFWFFSAILGDPAGQDGRNDGKESILGVRNWWERWLSRALR